RSGFCVDSARGGFQISTQQRHRISHRRNRNFRLLFLAMARARMIEQAERVMSSAYMQWAKTHLQARFNLASSGLEPYSLAKLCVKIDNLELTGPSFYGY